MRSACWDDVDYPVTQPFLPGPPAVHCGIDIGCPSGTIIKAARAGVVETVVTGIVGVHVDGGPFRDFYVHGYSLVLVGQRVAQGTPVIHSDTVQADPRYPLTGPHLHFEVQDGFVLPGAPPAAPERPVDPVPILLGEFMTADQIQGVIRSTLIACLAGSRVVTDNDVATWYQVYQTTYSNNLGLTVEGIQQHPECLAAQAKLNAVLAGIPSGTKFTATVN